MRALIVSDIHGNLEALGAVLSDARRQGPVDEVWCLGDVVGYGPDPGACVDLMASQGAAAVAGNHDLAAVGVIGLGDFNPHAAEAAQWAGEQLNEVQRAYLRGLPRILERAPFTLVHGSLRDPVWDYFEPSSMSLHQMAEAFQIQKTPFCLVGQSHVPLVCVERGLRFGLLQEGDLLLETDTRLVVNPGSVGQPRDGDPRASYLLYEAEGRRLLHRRIAYDVAAVQSKMRRVGLPEPLAARLGVGA
ncbi:MAG: metallophosphoesterase [Dehalococcoidia bacterium]|nr:metallophosphoesterase [Dehalococcoidia bacterium]